MNTKLLPCDPKYYRLLSGYNGKVFMPDLKFCKLVQPQKMPISAFLIFSNAQYKLPHTVADIIVLPFKSLRNVRETIRHELIHILFRVNPRHNLINKFVMKYKMVRVNLPPHLNFKVNPDTPDQWGLLRGNKIITKILHPGETFYKIRTYTIIRGDWYIASQDDLAYYNRMLPFNQNYHPHEMIANLISKKNVWDMVF